MGMGVGRSGWIGQFVRFHGSRRPESMGAAEVVSFLTDLAEVKGRSAATRARAVGALQLFYREVIGRELGDLGPVAAVQPAVGSEPTLTPEEAARFLASLPSVPRMVATLICGCGLRLTECLRLRIRDLDLERGELRIRNLHGEGDRVAVIPGWVGAELLGHLERRRQRWERDMNRLLPIAVDVPSSVTARLPMADLSWDWQWMFAATNVRQTQGIHRRYRRQLDVSAIQRAFKDGAREAGLSGVTPSALWDSGTWRTAPPSAAPVEGAPSGRAWNEELPPWARPEPVPIRASQVPAGGKRPRGRQAKSAASAVGRPNSGRLLARGHP